MKNVYLLYKEGDSIPELIFNEFDNLYYFLDRGDNIKVIVDGSEEDSYARMKNAICENKAISYVTIHHDAISIMDGLGKIDAYDEHYVVFMKDVKTNPNPKFW